MNGAACRLSCCQRGRLFDKAIRHRRTHSATARKDRREPVATGIVHHGAGDWLSVEKQGVDLPVSIKAMQRAADTKTKHRLVPVSWNEDVRFDVLKFRHAGLGHRTSLLRQQSRTRGEEQLRSKFPRVVTAQQLAFGSRSATTGKMVRKSVLTAIRPRFLSGS